MEKSCNLSHAHCNLSSPVEKQLEAFGQCMERLSPRALMDVHAGHSTLKYFLYLPEVEIPLGQVGFDYTSALIIHGKKYDFSVILYLITKPSA